MTLQRLVLDYRTGELVLRVLYRRSLQDGPNPGTKARRREVEDLARDGLRQALEALEAGAECVGTSGFTTREDVLLATTSPDAAKLVKGVWWHEQKPWTPSWTGSSPGARHRTPGRTRTSKTRCGRRACGPTMPVGARR